ncbi:hypothetical protein HK104_005632 [Borealophlyctis nickersoniae]|nr:hypothetical protein HK104_005632 [Borealophlyctis nickersoniae]
MNPRAELKRSSSSISFAQAAQKQTPPTLAPESSSPENVAKQPNDTNNEASGKAEPSKDGVGPSHAARGVTAGEANGKCAIFWDFENCPPPANTPGYVVVDSIRRVVHHFGAITMFKAYLQISETTKKSLRSELQSSGVSLTDTPHNSRKDAADKMILVDMLAFAIDHPPPATIILISGDRDFVYALSTLRNRRYNVILIVPNKGASMVLKSQANSILEWRYDVLNMDVSTALSPPPTTSTPDLGLSRSGSMPNLLSTDTVPTKKSSKNEDIKINVKNVGGFGDEVDAGRYLYSSISAIPFSTYSSYDQQDYMEKAAKAGIVILGGDRPGAQPWIAMNEQFATGGGF